MSDYDEFDDGFDADESFFAAIDSIEATATASSASTSTAPTTARAAPAVRPSITSILGTNSPFKPPSAAVARQTARVNDTHAESGPSRRAAALGVRPPRPHLPPAPPLAPSSDDFDDFNFSEEALAQIDAAGARGHQRTAIPSSNLNRGGRPFNRQNSFHQTHLNFHRENPYTKGKRWDRTAYAASGRRLDADKAKKKAKGKRNDDESEDEAPLLPDGIPPIDTSKPYEPQLHSYDPEAIKTYIYPTNHPKRRYQYEIVRNCFTDNTLVAIPTGLGKTFVAGVVMLNFFRWFPSGKIVFMAPTKPLVNQQIEACQLTCGIPHDAAAVINGSVSSVERDRLWEEKRVFYCTPQTLQNDLERGAIDARDIVLAVVDEAHRASGSYAYTTVIARITAVSPYFRVLALTATPGNKVDKVQGVVDGLHISRIEIREAESPEITQYTNEKRVELHTIPVEGVVRDTMRRWAELMHPLLKRLVDKNVLTPRDLDATRLRPFTVQAKLMELGRHPQFKWIWGPMQQVRQMAAAMQHLLEYSLGTFHEKALQMSGASNDKGKKGNSRGGANALHNNREYQMLMTDVETALNEIKGGREGKTRADLHPKMKKTLDLLLAHFAQSEDDAEVHGTKNDTRAMVFTSFRDSVAEIVDALNDHPGLLRPTRFVGQSDGKKAGDRGLRQKDQKQAIADFKEGKFNILVSTSVGEEGLDIGEVDFIILYDMPQQSIKQIQRIGRTGRKRDGIVHVLMTEGREDGNWEKAQQTHRDIQREILLNANLELFEDVERLLPPGDLPTCVEKEMPVDAWDPGAKGKRKQLAGASKLKAKRAPVMAVPEGAEGFKSVSAWLKEGTKGKRGKNSGLRDYDDEDSEGDGEQGSSGKTKSDRPRKARKSDKPKTAAELAAEAAAEKAAAAERERQEREELDNEAIDFFNTQGLVRAPPPGLFDSPPARSPSQASSSGIVWTPSPKRADHALPAESPSKSSPFKSPAQPNGKPNGTPLFQPTIDLSLDDDDEDIFKEEPPAPKASTLDKSMPPPPLPTKSSPYSPKVATPLSRPAQLVPASTPMTDSTEPTPFPVRTRRRIGIVGSSPDMSPAQSLQRLRRRGEAIVAAQDDSSPVAMRRRRKRLRGAYADHEMLDLDAAVSGSEASGDESSGSENSQDRMFAGDFAATQAPRGYDQHAVYAAGLSTQACARAGLKFDRDGATERAAFLSKARKAVLLSDDERDRERDSEDEYEVGSFVCDDEDISFASELKVRPRRTDSQRREVTRTAARSSRRVPSERNYTPAAKKQ